MQLTEDTSFILYRKQRSIKRTSTQTATQALPYFENVDQRPTQDEV